MVQKVILSNKRDTSTVVAAAFLKLERMHSASVYRPVVADTYGESNFSLISASEDRWADFCQYIAVGKPSVEAILVTTNGVANNNHFAGIYMVALGRGRNASDASARAESGAESLLSFLNTSVDYTRWAAVNDRHAVMYLAEMLKPKQLVELQRREESIDIAFEAQSLRKKPLGFGDNSEPQASSENNTTVPFLFPWIAPEDTGRKLLNLLYETAGRAACAIHFKGQASPVAEACREAASRQAHFDQIVNGVGVKTNQSMQPGKLEVLARRGLERLSILEGSTVSARVFVLSDSDHSETLVTAMQTTIDAAVPEENQGKEMFFGGVCSSRCSATELIAPLVPTFSNLYGISEAAGLIRTPSPTDFELPFVHLARNKTGRMTGSSGEDIHIGDNLFNGERREVRMQEDARFRHMYVVGQTGTGKSTFLSHAIIQDINLGRGVAVLDPHGSLVDAVLENFPEDRKEDLILVDLADLECPVGFNPLMILASDEFEYCFQRDIIVQDLYNYIDMAYDLKQTGGPMFEMYFRSMLSLLLAAGGPDVDKAPNLILFRSLYTDENLRDALGRLCKDNDFVLKEFLREAESVRGDASLSNIAPYITSKLIRFISDQALRNITCQNRTLDFEDIVNNKRVLLFHLGKGRIGDSAAGLLASQIVSRIKIETMRRGANSGRNPFYLYADEFQLFANEQFSELLAEGRKFGLAITIAHQFTHQLPDKVLESVLGNVGTSVLFRVGGPDGEHLEHVTEPVFNSTDICNQPNYTAYVRSYGKLSGEPFSIESLKQSTGDMELAERMREYSRKKHGRPRAEVEAEIVGTLLEFRNWAKEMNAEHKEEKESRISLEDLFS